MTLSTDVRDNEAKKFRDAGSNGTRVAVVLEQSSPILVEFSQTVFSEIITSPDRVDLFSYFDTGSRNERIVKIEYSSATIHPGLVATKNFSYDAIGSKFILRQISKTLVSA
jgi:hypothetical protein